MRKVWLLGLAAAAILVVGPMLVAYAADDGTTPPKHKAGPAEGKTPPPPIVVDEAKMPELAKAVKDTEAAIAALQAQAVKDLGEKDARRLVAQTVSKAVRGTRPEASKGEGRKRAGGGDGGRHVPGGAPDAGK
jgi:hypothetical protein